MQLKYSLPSLSIIVPLFFLLNCLVTPFQAQEVNYSVEFQARARSMDDLRYVIGSNFNLFVATYWRYMLVSCEVFQEQLTYDRQSRVLVK
ncbi:hypothetical protein ElyMa_003311600, partial [Elysia marginata]